MARERLTKRVVDAAELPAAGVRFIWDSELRGFGLRVTVGGSKSYVLQYRMKGKPARRMTLGAHGSPWTTEGARKEAERRLIKIRQGIDPVEEERRIAEALRQEAEERRLKAEEEARARVEAERQVQLFSFDVYADRFVELYLKENWKDSWEEAERILKRLKPHFAGKTMGEIVRTDVVELLDTYASRPGSKKIAHSVLRLMFNWAADRGDLEKSPIANMKAPKALASRRRVLTPEELVSLWPATAGLHELWSAMIRLLILTLQRREEVAALDWSEIDLDQRIWQLPPERAKNDQPHRVWLNDLAMEELKALGPRRRGLVFTTTGDTPMSGFSKVKKQLDGLLLETMQERAEKRGEDRDEIQLAPWRYHDLRRTGTTNLQALGVPVEVTEAILNHVSGSTGGIAGVYNLYRYDREKRIALDTWSKQLSTMIRSGTGTVGFNVVPFARYAA